MKNMERKKLLSTNKRTIQNRIPVSITYSRYLLNISNISAKYWNILQISPILQKVFENKPMITYKRNKNFGELRGGHTLQGGKVFKTYLQIIKDKSKSCNTRNKSSFCCTQLVNTKTFESYQTKKMFKIFHKLNCTSNFAMYLMKCTLCKVQYAGKAETLFNI